MPALHKTAISRKTKSFGTFWAFLLDSMDLWHLFIKLFKTIDQKIKFTNLNMCSLLQAKHLLITQDKKDGVVKMILSYRLQQYVGVELHMI